MFRSKLGKIRNLIFVDFSCRWCRVVTELRFVVSKTVQRVNLLKVCLQSRQKEQTHIADTVCRESAIQIGCCYHIYVYAKNFKEGKFELRILTPGTNAFPTVF
jgi:hypothetical protein